MPSLIQLGKRQDAQGKELAQLKKEVAFLRKMMHDKLTELAERTVIKILEAGLEAEVVSGPSTDDQLKNIFGTLDTITGDFCNAIDKVKRTCGAVQHSDQTICTRCNLTWDTNDPHPPPCKPIDHIEGDNLRSTELGKAK